MKSKSIWIPTPIELILAKAELLVAEVDEIGGFMHLHGLDYRNEVLLRELANAYNSFNVISESLVEATDPLEVTRLIDRFLDKTQGSKFVYWRNKKPIPKNYITYDQGYCILTFPFCDWPDEEEQIRLMHSPLFLQAQMTAYEDQTIELKYFFRSNGRTRAKEKDSATALRSKKRSFQ